MGRENMANVERERIPPEVWGTWTRKEGHAEHEGMTGAATWDDVVEDKPPKVCSVLAFRSV
jgi:hypothetical protein